MTPETRSHFVLQPDAEPLPGYRLVERLGGGGYGEVWRALAPGGFSVALKFVRLEADVDTPELRALDVIREIRHANLLLTFGAWNLTPPGPPFRSGERGSSWPWPPLRIAEARRGRGRLSAHRHGVG